MTQKEAFDILKMGYNVFLTGAAGSGKTYLLNAYIKFLHEQGVAVAVTASTGIAATHSNGITLHAWAGFGIRESLDPDDIRMIAEKKRYRGRFFKTKVLVIDEVSMLHAHHLEMTDAILRAARDPWKPFGGLQVVLCGDFFQLPPVTKEGSKPAKFIYESAVWHELDPTICYLEEQHRQDDKEFLRVLGDIRNNSVSEATRIPLRRAWRRKRNGTIYTTKLFAHNADVDAMNARELRQLEGKSVSYSMTSRGPSLLVRALKKGCLAPEEFIVKKGARVMFIKNNFEKGYVNGTLGEVIDFEKDTGYPMVKTNTGKCIVADPEDWSVEEEGKVKATIAQVPLRLAWAITVHKSQGMTLDAAEVDLSRTFEKGMGYVALSRVRTLQGLNLTGMNELAFLVNEKVFASDCKFRTMSGNAGAMLQEFSREEREAKKRVFLRSCGGETAEKNREGSNEKKESEKTYSIDEIQKKHTAAYMSWTEKEEDQLKQLFLLGMPVRELAKIHGRQRGGIISRLKKMGLDAPG